VGASLLRVREYGGTKEQNILIWRGW